MTAVGSLKIHGLLSIEQRGLLSASERVGREQRLKCAKIQSNCRIPRQITERLTKRAVKESAVATVRINLFKAKYI